MQVRRMEVYYFLHSKLLREKGFIWIGVGKFPDIPEESCYNIGRRISCLEGNVMAEICNWMVAQLEFPEDCNVILGQSHFIKTVEDLYEALVTSSPNLEFGIAFCEASGPCLIRHDGNKEDLVEIAIKNAEKVSAGHFFIVVLRKGYPINVMERIKGVQEVCRIFAATANPLQVLIAETDQGRGVVGVVDGFSSKGVESSVDIEERKNLLRNIIGYKR